MIGEPIENKWFRDFASSEAVPTCEPCGWLENLLKISDFETLHCRPPQLFLQNFIGEPIENKWFRDSLFSAIMNLMADKLLENLLKISDFETKPWYQ